MAKAGQLRPTTCLQRKSAKWTSVLWPESEGALPSIKQTRNLLRRFSVGKPMWYDCRGVH